MLLTIIAIFVGTQIAKVLRQIRYWLWRKEWQAAQHLHLMPVLFGEVFEI